MNTCKDCKFYIVNTCYYSPYVENGTKMATDRPACIEFKPKADIEKPQKPEMPKCPYCGVEMRAHKSSYGSHFIFCPNKDCKMLVETPDCDTLEEAIKIASTRVE